VLAGAGSIDRNAWAGSGDNGVMGLFASRPEDPFEWAGLPSEPLRAHTDAELLEDTPTDLLALATDSGLASIPIRADPPVVDAREPDDED
jgi:hypothetical protein